MNFVMLTPANDIRIAGDWFVFSDDLSLLALTYMPFILFAMQCYLLVIIAANAPEFARRAAFFLLFGSSLGLVASLIVAYVTPEVIVIMDTGYTITTTVVLYRHPGIFSFVPYKAEYVVLLKKDGELAFEYWWRRREERPMTDAVLAGASVEQNETRDVIGNVMRRYASIMNGLAGTGNVTEFETDRGVYLIYLGSKHFIAGLLARRSSPSLREGFKLFVKQVDAIHEMQQNTRRDEFNQEVAALIESRMLGTQSVAA